MARSGTATIHQFKPGLKPRTFTKAEQVIEYMAQLVISDGRSYKKIAEQVGVSGSTLGKLANRSTRWPRPTTLFPLMQAMNVHLEIRKNE